MNKFIFVLSFVAIAQCALPDSAYSLGWGGISDTCSGITVGRTDDKEVVARLGGGLFVGKEGAFGGRYYIAPDGAMTLHLVTGTDAVVWELTLTRGIALPSGCKPVKAILPINLLEAGIRLGDSPQRVTALLGKPSKDKSVKGNRTLEFYNYRNAPADEAGNSATFSFINGRLVKVRLYCGD
ncbi:hypothetical protein J7643_06415 [bacterium]|nr:hypothetical protein [bacterium]